MKKKQVTTQKHYSPRAILVAIGTKIRALKLLQPIEELVRIRQKTVKYSPLQKLTDGLIAILAGAHGFSEINMRLRSGAALQRAFGRTGCAEQSVVQETLDACSATNVKQMALYSLHYFSRSAGLFRMALGASGFLLMAFSLAHGTCSIFDTIGVLEVSDVVRLYARIVAFPLLA